MKLKHLSSIHTQTIPDHILQEIKDLCDQIQKVLEPIFEDIPANYILSALNIYHACMIKYLISDKEEAQNKAAMVEAMALINNVAFSNNLPNDEI